MRFAFAVGWMMTFTSVAGAAEKFVQFSIPADADIIAESHQKGQKAVDAAADVGGSCFLSESEARFRMRNRAKGRGPGFGDGLPDDGKIGNVQLLPYDQANVAQRHDETPIEIKPPQQAYRSVTFYLMAGSDTDRPIDGCAIALGLTYDKGDPGEAKIVVPDWFVQPIKAKYLIRRLDRTLWSFEGTLDHGIQDCDGANIFAIEVPVDSARQLKEIQLIRRGPAGIVSLFAASGNAIVQEDEAKSAPSKSTAAGASPAPSTRPVRTAPPIQPAK